MPFFSKKRSRPHTAASAQPAPITTAQESIQSTSAVQNDHHLDTPIAVPAELKQPASKFSIPYEPINSAEKEIRLLRVFAGKKTDPVRCKIQHTKLLSGNTTPYETVSYCWGPNPGQTVIEIDGVDAIVTRSAVEVLQRMRYAEKDRVLWIDAICINQHDKVEQGEQVAFMGEIYRHTSRNLIWLGNCSGFGYRVHTTLEALNFDIQQKTQNYKSLFEMTREKVPRGEPASAQLSHSGTLLDPWTANPTALKILFSSPWFSRLWVVQEACLPEFSVCYFGPVSFALLDVLRVAVWISFNRPQMIQGAHCQGIEQAANLWMLVDSDIIPEQYFRKSGDQLATLYNLLYSREATEAKDRIYALLGLYNNPSLPAIVPDYIKSDEEVFRDVTRRMIEDRGSLDILHWLSSNVCEPDSPLPSWVVRFESKRTGTPTPILWVFNAASGQMLQGNTNFHGDPNVLCLTGITADHIKATVSPLPDLNDADIWPFLCEISQLVSNHARGSHIVQKLAFTLMAGVDWRERPLSSESDDVKYFECFLEYVSKHRRNPRVAIQGGPFEGKKLQGIGQGYRAIINACSYRRVFVTRNGRLGIGPLGVEDGDIIAILHGGGVPFALRKIEGTYRIIGACFVSGIMHGEAMRTRNGKRPEEVFHMR